MDTISHHFMRKEGVWLSRENSGVTITVQRGGDSFKNNKQVNLLSMCKKTDLNE